MAVSALVIDDGELTDVRELLGELGVEYCWIRASAAQGVKYEAPARLLVTTARHALQAEPGDGEASARPVRMVVLADEARSASAQLRERGFDYVVRRPVHPVALQLLLLRALYRGEERRVSTRVAIGCGTTYRTTFRRRPALLVDLSRGGCRFHTAKQLDADREIQIQLPKELTGGEAIDLPGWVVRCERDPAASMELPFCAAVAFQLLPDETDEKLRAVLEARANGPERLNPRDAEQAWQEWTQRAAGRKKRREAAAPKTGRGARRTPRRGFRSRIAAVTQRDRALRTLVGRNISAGGMLLEPETDLQVGDRIALALFGKPGQRLQVRARVVRSDAQGLALVFDTLSAPATLELEKLVAGLPAAEDGESTGSIAAVVGEITGRSRSGPVG
jgi:hypothetical protein